MTAADNKLAADIKPVGDPYADVRTYEVLLQDEREKRVARAERREKIAYSITVAALAAAVFAFSQPRPAPPLWVLNENTGTLRVIDSVADQRRTMGEARDRREIREYVMMRERYYSQLALNDFRSVRTRSSAAVQQDFARLWTGENSRQSIYGERGEIEITVGPIVVDVENGSARVWYMTQGFRNGTPSEPECRMATLRYSYPGIPDAEETRRYNETGFLVSEYVTYPDEGACK